MRAEGFVLPELFARPRVQFRARAQQARTEATRRVASLRTARPGLRPIRIMPSVGRLGALFAKPDTHDAPNTQTPSRSTKPANRLTKPTKNRASAHAKPSRPCRAPGRRRVGMCVALPRVAMLLSELTIIYLATAAPFGVARFVEDRERGTRGAGALARSAAAALAWPATALLFALRSVAPRTVEAEAW